MEVRTVAGFLDTTPPIYGLTSEEVRARSLASAKPPGTAGPARRRE
jgi:hypothetical protein